MKRTPLYSTPRRREPVPAAQVPTVEAASAAAGAPPAAAPMAIRPPSRWRAALPFVATALLGALLAVLALRYGPAAPRALTQKDIDRAVLHTLDKHPLPAPAAKAFEAVRGSVVKVIGYSDRKSKAGDDKDAKSPKATPAPSPKGGKDPAAKPVPKDDKSAKAPKPNAPPPATRPQILPDPKAESPKPDEDEDRGVGTGVVIVDNGTILTNLHVVYGAKRIKVIFADGLESEADVIALQPQHDLAVLKARKIPDDLQAATMRSTGDLRPGDRVTAVGFPFSIGPSVSHGVVSGMKREFRSPEGKRILTNLIQFDAAANPGNSGGPLVTDDGEVVGIVTAIYNPTEERFFVGIGFAVPIENAAAAAGLPPF